MTSTRAAHRAATAGGGSPAGTAGRVGVRVVLLAGFAVLVALWIAAVTTLAFRVSEANQSSIAMTAQFIHTEDALQAIRTGVLLAAIDWRDAFLDATEGRTPYYRAQLLEHQRLCMGRLSDLRTGNDAWVTREAVDALEREVQSYWEGVLPLIDLTAPRQDADIRRILNERILPKRALVIRIVQQVQEMNRAGFQRQQLDTARLFSRARTRVAITGVVATLLSLLIGAVVIVHVGRLEGRLRGELAANARITSDLHRLSAQLARAQEDERRLIARELHDEIGQALTAVKMQLSLVGRSVAASDQRVVEEARSVVDTALQAVRNLSRLLHPPMLEDMGLAAALTWHLRTFSERTGVAASIEHDDMEPRPPREIETCLFRIVQEATTNIARHAGATRCRVFMQRLPSSMVLSIEDDGRGIESAGNDASPPRGLGLLGIQERVADLGGTFRLDSAPRRGTRLTVELPVSPEPEPDALAEDVGRETEGGPDRGTNPAGR